MRTSILCRRTTTFDVVILTHVGRGVYLGSATPPIPIFSAPQFWGFSCIYAYTVPLTQNDQIRDGDTYGEGCVLGQPCHCICTNASRGLSAIVEFLENKYMDCVDEWRCAVGLRHHVIISEQCVVSANKL